MIKQQFFKAGQPIMLRQLSCGKIWEARPAIVVRDAPELLACFVPPGSIWKKPAEDIRPAGRARESWSFRDSIWGFGGILRLTVPAVGYSVLLLRNMDGSIHQWYINLEDTMRRTRLGFDYRDNILDAVVAPNLLDWGWRDEDELAETVSAGLVSPEQSATFYAQGRAAVALLQSGKSVYNAWATWKPDPSWKMPVLPEGWDKI